MRTSSRPARQHLKLLLLSALLGSCTSPPRPPAADETSRRPANAAADAALQVCRNDLANTRLFAVESERLAHSTSAAIERLAAEARATRANAMSPSGVTAGSSSGNHVYTVHFDFASAHAVVPAESGAALLAEARVAPLIVLRGRTDGMVDTLAEGRIARERTATVRDYLVSAGIDPARIRATWQPVGDGVAENTDAAGRTLNRRVEVEIYRAPPVAVASPQPTRP